MIHPDPIAALRDCARRLAQAKSGLALMEFALTLPLVLTVGGYGIELSSVALTNMRISQYALNLADTTSRLGLDAGGGVIQLREADVNDAFQGIRLASTALDLATNGRVTLSSLENTKQTYDTAYVQRIHWQRCFGKMSGVNYDSSYGTTKATDGTSNTAADAGTVTTAGMGPTGGKVSAPQDNAVMFVEINYNYKPLFGSMFVAPQVIRYTGSLLVRDNRDYRQIYNPTPAATASTCDKYTS